MNYQCLFNAVCWEQSEEMEAQEIVKILKWKTDEKIFVIKCLCLLNWKFSYTGAH
jgi:hypothetical protein